MLEFSNRTSDDIRSMRRDARATPPLRALLVLITHQTTTFSDCKACNGITKPTCWSSDTQQKWQSNC